MASQGLAPDEAAADKGNHDSDSGPLPFIRRPAPPQLLFASSLIASLVNEQLTQRKDTLDPEDRLCFLVNRDLATLAFACLCLCSRRRTSYGVCAHSGNQTVLELSRLRRLCS